MTAFGLLLRDVVPGEAMGLAYLAAVIVGASLGGLRPALAVAAASFLAWDFFFIPPVGTVTIGSVQDVMALLLFAFVAVLSGTCSPGACPRRRARGASADRRAAPHQHVQPQAGRGRDRAGTAGRDRPPGRGVAGQAVVLAPAGGERETHLDIRAAEPAADTAEPTMDTEAGAWAGARMVMGKAGEGGAGHQHAAQRELALHAAARPRACGSARWACAAPPS